MGKQPGEERGCLGERGQSSVIGVVLILGIVITSLAVIATVGGLALLDTEDELSVARAEKVMTQFDSQSALVALGETDARQTRLASGNSGGYTLDEDAGWMRVSIRNTTDNTTQVVQNVSSLGSLTYETDGVRLAYQAGGVWQKGDGDAVMVSPPEFHYRGQTLTLPVINVTGDGQVSRQVSVRQSEVSQGYPDRAGNSEFVNPVPENRAVTVTVKSEYYRGWGSYFERRTEGNVSYDKDSQTASITLTVPIEENFDNTVTATGTVGSKVKVPGSVEQGATRPSASNLIDEKISDCKSGGGWKSIPADSEFDGGTYYSDSGVVLDTAEFNTGSANSKLVVNGTVTFGPGNHNITGNGNVTLYIKGNISIKGSARINNQSSPDLLTYVHSDAGSVTAAKGTPQYTGLIYAPNTDLDIKGGGKCKKSNGNGNGNGNDCNGNIVGSVVAKDVNSKGGGKIRKDKDADITLEFDDSITITYLHIWINSEVTPDRGVSRVGVAINVFSFIKCLLPSSPVR